MKFFGKLATTLLSLSFCFSAFGCANLNEPPVGENSGSNNGGSSKFAAKLELPKAKNMLDGMSATASLPMLEKNDIPTIPVVALVAFQRVKRLHTRWSLDN